MKQKIKIFLVALTTIAACGVFASTLVHAAFYYQPEEEAPPPPGVAVTATPRTNKEIPTRLLIPAIHVDANIQSVGIGKSGNMAVPNNFTDVGWYRYGPVPGHAGSAVIDGHVDNGFGTDAVFKHIEELQPGDGIYVETNKNTRAHFIVDEVKTYNSADVPLQTIFNSEDGSHLNLITCAGTWLPAEKAYDKRVVVYATLQE